MPRSLVLASCLAVLACGCSEPATGHCTGTLAGKPFDADIDPHSEHHTVQRQVCTQPRSKTRWNFSYGEGALQITALSPETNNLSLSSQELPLPPALVSWFEDWTILAPREAAAVSGGAVTLDSGFDLSPALRGSFRMALEDGSELECTFDLPQAHDEGRDIDCPDEHHDDDDDWDD